MKLFFNHSTLCLQQHGHQDHIVSELLVRKAELHKALKAIQRVREIHKPLDIVPRGLTQTTFCDECSVINGLDEDRYVKYPCPTIKALDGKFDE